MKLLTLIGLMAFTLSCNAETKKTLPVPNFDAKKLEAAVKAGTNESKKEEDCDDKAKKPIEIKEESISLTGNTGCSLEEVK